MKEFSFTNDYGFTICVGRNGEFTDEDRIYIQTHDGDENSHDRDENSLGNVVYIDAVTAQRVVETLEYFIEKEGESTNDEGAIYY